jgi:hypothetical protein
LHRKTFLLNVRGQRWEEIVSIEQPHTAAFLGGLVGSDSMEIERRRWENKAARDNSHQTSGEVDGD